MVAFISDKIVFSHFVQAVLVNEANSTEIKKLYKFNYLRVVADEVEVQTEINSSNDFSYVFKFIVEDVVKGKLDLGGTTLANLRIGMLGNFGVCVLLNDLDIESETYRSYQISNFKTDLIEEVGNKILNEDRQIEEEQTCCVCLDEFPKMAFVCKTCNEGTVCKKCAKNLKGVRSCPVCRTHK